MFLTPLQTLLMILAIALGTLLTRALPFLLFPQDKEPPRFIRDLTTLLPPAVMGLLVVYCLKGINTTEHQRIIGCYNCEIDGIFFCKSHNAFNIFCTDIHASCIFRDTAVTGQCVQSCYFGIFFDFFDDGMLSAAATNYHYLHLNISFRKTD